MGTKPAHSLKYTDLSFTKYIMILYAFAKITVINFNTLQNS